MIHPFAERWRARRRSPYVILLPAWMTMWAIMALATRPWRHVSLYSSWWTWLPASFLFALGFYLYAKSGKSFSAQQLGGLPELHDGHRDQRLVTSGIRARVRHPVYLAHLCEMLAWSIGTGLAVCWTLTVLAIVTGAVMFGWRMRNWRRDSGTRIASIARRCHQCCRAGRCSTRHRNLIRFAP